MNIYFCGVNETYIDLLRKQLMFKLKHYENELSFSQIIYSTDIIPSSNQIQVYICVPESDINTINGIEFSEIIRKRNPHAIIIFLSKNLISAIDILKKNIGPTGYFMYSEIEEAVEFIAKLIEQKKIDTHSNDIKIEIISKYKKISVPLEDIIYFVSCNKKILCHLDNGEFIEFYGTLSNLEKIHGNVFIRCHAGYLVNKQKIMSINYSQGYMKVIHSKENIPISRKYRPQIKSLSKANLKK